MSFLESQVYIIIFSALFLGGVMSTFVISMVFIHRQRQAQNRQKLDQVKSEHEKTLLDIENEIQQETLTLIGRELHDNIGQLLSLAKLNFGSIRPEKQAEGRDILGQAIQEVRGLSKQLNLDWVESLSINEFIGQQLERIQNTGFCETTLDADFELVDLPKDQKLVLIRVIQESLNNAIKHASPNKILIRMHDSGKGKQIWIKDDGKGFDSSQKSNGSGMINLKKRMETIGGEFELTSTVGNGTEITLTLPN
ncbi:sensor histidine kinase [Algoriphagus antarcticus]|uniref:Oxygen sensor histidine kinase NreB n=1 Tax=Algoriphagus antarcticus TaxID=238540 RepID=A0A3E0DEU1_9BACT|nr:ATP-binding protein [Algoriphagus antarcticus]REG81097.1 signal transduction histidine kinase [Algoriphagus antarcticus]